jgi:hypothetical protein
MRYSGKDPIPNGFTGTTFFMSNGWRVIYDPNSTAVDGVLFSEDFDTAYWSSSLQPIYPVSVSAVVNQVTTTQNVVTGDLSSIASASDVASHVRAAIATELGKIIDLAKVHGLIQGVPVQVSETQRVAGDVVQSIVDSGGTITVSRE